MHSRRLLDLFVIGLSALSVAEATFNNRRVDVRDVKAIEQRQGTEVDDKPTAAATDSKSDAPTTSAAPSSTPPTKEPSSTPPTPSAKPSSTPPPVVSTTSTTPQAPSETKKPPVQSPSTPGQQPPTESSTNAPPPPPQTSRVVSTITHRLTVTNEDGSQSTLTSESLTTATPGLAGGATDSPSGGSGMTPQTRNTVIGVVVGVGGAIILIGLGFVAWRIWGRRKNQDEQDGLMDYTSPNDGKSEVGGSMSGRTPFQSTLESYHAPTNVNQAANF